MDTVRIEVELVDTDFVGTYDVDPSRPLVELVQRIAAEQNVPLRTRQGRPLAWTAEGPEWRDGKEHGTTDLVRTQPLTKVVDRALAQGVPRSPLFRIWLTIPGANRELEEQREAAKRAEIESRLAARKEERVELGILSTADTAMEFEDDDEETLIEPIVPPKPRPKKVRRKPPPKKKPLPWALIGGAIAAAVLLGLLALVLTREPEPEPVVVATPPPTPIEIPMATPTPTPTPKATPTPAAGPPFKRFYSRGEVTPINQKETGAQISSYAQTNARISYTVHLDGPGSHTIKLKNRFEIKLSDSGGRAMAAGPHNVSAQLKVGKPNKITVHYVSDTVRLRVGGRSYGPWTTKASSSFLGWQFFLDPGMRISGLKASSQDFSAE